MVSIIDGWTDGLPVRIVYREPDGDQGRRTDKRADDGELDRFTAIKTSSGSSHRTTPVDDSSMMVNNGIPGLLRGLSSSSRSFWVGQKLTGISSGLWALMFLWNLVAGIRGGPVPPPGPRPLDRRDQDGEGGVAEDEEGEGGAGAPGVGVNGSRKFPNFGN